jgi:hypothetical protein
VHERTSINACRFWSSARSEDPCPGQYVHRWRRSLAERLLHRLRAVTQHGRKACKPFLCRSPCCEHERTAAAERRCLKDEIYCPQTGASCQQRACSTYSRYVCCLQVHTSLQTAEARLALLEARLASAAPAAAADADASTDARPPALDSRDGLSPGASADATAVDDAVAAATQSRTDWEAEAGAAAGVRRGAGDSTSDSAEDDAGVDGSRP